MCRLSPRRSALILARLAFVPGLGSGVLSHGGSRVIVFLRPAGPTSAVRSVNASAAVSGAADDDDRKSEKGATAVSLKYVGRDCRGRPLGELLLGRAGGRDGGVGSSFFSARRSAAGLCAATPACAADTARARPWPVTRPLRALLFRFGDEWAAGLPRATRCWCQVWRRGSLSRFQIPMPQNSQGQRGSLDHVVYPMISDPCWRGAGDRLCGLQDKVFLSRGWRVA